MESRIHPMRARHLVEAVRQWARFCIGKDDIDAASDAVVTDVIIGVEDARRGELQRVGELACRDAWLRSFDEEGRERWPMDKPEALHHA